MYHGKALSSGEQVAVKIEPIKAKHPQLMHENTVYADLMGVPGVPLVRWFGFAADYRAMVMDLLGPSLEELFNYCYRKFSVKTVLLLADQMARP